jgi:hydroxyatrazine ethylaminohydrolase
MHRVVVAPCQPANCTEATFADAAALARSHGVRLHTHLGEGENEVMRARTGRASIDWCEALGFAGRDTWIAHGWEFEPHELRQLAAAGTGVSHCPMPVFLVGQRITDLVGMLDAGVRTGLGVDGQASNDSSNLLECVRSAYLLHTLAAGLHGRRPPQPAELLHIATAGGADLLGCPELGRLAPGMAADFFAVDVSGIEFAGTLHDPVSLPAKVGCSGPVKLTVVAGQMVWRDGAFTTFDEATHARAARALADTLEDHWPEAR